jgi:microcystin-dependent protein
MASTYTSNLAVEKPGSGDYVGTWDVPVNADLDVFDRAIGTIQVIDLSGGSVTLSTAQARSAFLNFIGAMPSNVTVTIPGLSSAPGTVVSGKSYICQHLCSNTSAYTITLQTTVAGQEVICLPPSNATTVIVQGTNSSQAGSLKFGNLERIGTLVNLIGSSVPNWVTQCTVPPYLNCDGTAISSALYPILVDHWGWVQTPDLRSRVPVSLGGGAGLLSSDICGINGDSWGASGGAQGITLSSAHIPPVPITDPGHNHGITSTSAFNYNISAAVGTIVFNTATNKGSTSSTQTSSFGVTQYSNTGITAGNVTPTTHANVQPTYVFGITMVRAG